MVRENIETLSSVGFSLFVPFIVFFDILLLVLTVLKIR